MQLNKINILFPRQPGLENCLICILSSKLQNRKCGIGILWYEDSILKIKKMCKIGVVWPRHFLLLSLVPNLLASKGDRLIKGFMEFPGSSRLSAASIVLLPYYFFWVAENVLWKKAHPQASSQRHMLLLRMQRQSHNQSLRGWSKWFAGSCRTYLFASKRDNPIPTTVVT